MLTYEIIQVGANKIELDEEIIKKTINYANKRLKLPTCNYLILISDGFFTGNQSGCLGFCMPRSLHVQEETESIVNEYLGKSWDIAIGLSENGWLHFNQYPAYLAYLLGHELGHGFISLKDEDSHIFGCLIYDFIKNNAKVPHTYQLYNEICFDQLGVILSKEVFNNDKIFEEIKEIKKNPECPDTEYYEFLLSIKDFTDFSDLWEGLYKWLDSYNCKDEFVEYCNHQKLKGKFLKVFQKYSSAKKENKKNDNS